MSSQTSFPSSWHYTALTVLSGVGAGYLLGIASGRLIWGRGRRSRPPPPGPPAPAPSYMSNLVSVIGQLTAELGRLREVVAAAGLVSGQSYSRRLLNTADSTADFVSARGDSGDSESDTEFYETEEPGNSFKVDQQLAEFDELGKNTLESQEVCATLTERLTAAMEENGENIGLQWRLARVLVHSSLHCQQKEETEEEQSLLTRAVEHAQKALDLDGDSWQAHQWYAVALGSITKFEGTQEKIKKGHEYKEHINKAIELRPEEPLLHYLSGRWCFEVAGISWLEKKAAAALFATPPESSYEEALRYFMKTDELSRGTWKANMLMIAKCYLKTGDVEAALEWLNKALKLPTVNTEDETSQKEIESLLTEHQTES